jgi:hypothetical protein
MSVLSCPENYQVIVTDRFGQVQVGELEDVTSITWARELNNISQANVEVPGVECCGLLDKGVLGVVGRHLLIIRDGVTVWGPGPILSIDFTTGEIVARDVAEVIQHQVIHNDLCFDPSCGGVATDATAIAKAILVDALAGDDPNILAFVQVTPGATAIERSFLANSKYSLDAIQGLTQAEIKYTVIGRRILIGPFGTPFGTLATLTDDAFTGANNVVEDGFALVTRAVVLGAGDPPLAGSAGGVDSFYGRWERLTTADESIVSVAAANAAAASIVKASNPAPTYLSVPTGSILSPDAPVDINELVPGVNVPLLVTQSCRQLAATLPLHRVQVTFTALNGEQVRITTAPDGVELVSDLTDFLRALAARVRRLEHH